MIVRLAVALLFAGLAGCANPGPVMPPIWTTTDAQSLPRRALIDRVPFVPQERFYCGPAALTMALRTTGIDADPEAVGRAVYTPGREGTLRSDILAGARRWERMAIPLAAPGDLLREIAAGNPVVVFQNLSFNFFPQWHFAVALGYDLEAQTIVLHSGTNPFLQTDLETFQRTWRRGEYWGLVVTAPERIPETASERAALEAAAALERQKAAAAAAAAYSAISSRWPRSFAAAMGTGNVLLSAGRLDAAEAAFRNALEIRPDAPEAWNNLAYVMSGKGRGQEAVAAAEKAVRFASSRKDFYERSLDEIRAKAKRPG